MISKKGKKDEDGETEKADSLVHSWRSRMRIYGCRGLALSLADCVMLTDIYPARETDTLGVSSADIVALLKEKGVDAWYLPTFDDMEKFILENCTQGDLLITMGAGDIVKVGEELLGL